MTIKDVIKILDEWAPLAYAEDFDNTGLLVGNQNASVQGILVTLDTLENVVDEAISEGCNLIVSFHPIIFKGLKSLTGKTYVERAVLKAIKNDIAIVSIHTALDNSWNGVNYMICEKLGLKNRQILIAQSGTIRKLVTFVPTKEAEGLRNSLFEAGAGNIGNYENCSFNIEGIGSFQGNIESNPVIGEKGITHFEGETQIGVTYARHLETKILDTLFKNHPYEEVAYELTTLNNTNQHIGMGMIGTFESPISEEAFLKLLKDTFGTEVIRHSQKLGKDIHKVAVLGGSGSFAIGAAIAQGADVYVTADLKYHDFFMAEGRIVLADVGHFESEQYTKELIVAHLSKKITNFAPSYPKDRVIISKVNTNPISYY